MNNDFSDVTIQPPRTAWGRRLAAFAVLTILAVAGVAAAVVPSPLVSPPDSLGDAPTHTVRRGDLRVTVTEQGTLESANNTEIKCRVRGNNTIISVVESGAIVQPGDELVRLDTLLIEEEISERTKFAHLARSGAERARADMRRAEIAVTEYSEGRFVSELATLQKDLAIAEANLLSAQNLLEFTQMMSASKYASELDVEPREFAVDQAKLNVELTKTQIDVLEGYTKEEELATLRGNLNAAKAKYEAEKERAYADQQRLKRAQEELEFCVIKAESPGVVIYPSGKAWEDAPDIEEGATVHKDQVLLLMPDLTRMQVEVGIHESVVDRVKPGLSARVTLPTKTLDGKVASVAAVAKPAGWWTGNVVKYDSVIRLPEGEEGLKPGMSVEVEVVIAEHQDVLTIPAAAVMQVADGFACWVRQGDQAVRRKLKLGDSSEMEIEVRGGLREGEQVVIDPLAYVVEAQEEATRNANSERTNHFTRETSDRGSRGPKTN